MDRQVSWGAGGDPSKRNASSANGGGSNSNGVSRQGQGDKSSPLAKRARLEDSQPHYSQLPVQGPAPGYPHGHPYLQHMYPNGHSNASHPHNPNLMFLPPPAAAHHNPYAPHSAGIPAEYSNYAFSSQSRTLKKDPPAFVSNAKRQESSAGTGGSSPEIQKSQESTAAEATKKYSEPIHSTCHEKSDPDGYIATDLTAASSTLTANADQSSQPVIPNNRTGSNSQRQANTAKEKEGTDASSGGAFEKKMTNDVDASTTQGSKDKKSDFNNSSTPSSSSTNDEQNQPVRTSRRLTINSDPMVKRDEIVSTLLELPELSSKLKLEPLSPDELKDLEFALEITPGDPEESWKVDWSGNLALIDKEIPNPKKSARSGVGGGGHRQPLYTWGQKNNNAALKYIHYLFRYVYHLEDTPPMARTILANSDKKDGIDLELAFRRVSYDPTVLRQDGWITSKAPEPEGASGGANRIGDNVRWQGADGVVIAYIHDDDMGDLWRGLWLDEGLESFDMEAEELLDARKKWERRVNSSKGKSKEAKKKIDDRHSNRYNETSEFKVKGVEYGIVLAASFSKGARPGVYWPARVMNASEADSSPGNKNRRNFPRQRLDLVFLAPYWNSQADGNSAGSRRTVKSFAESLNTHGESLFSSGPLFHYESVDVTDEMIKEYPYDNKDGGINIDQLRNAFRFSGLPKAAFPRYLDSHRIALALKTFAQDHLPPRGSDHHASAGLFGTHPMSVTAPIYPPEVLHLPYTFILSQLPAPLSEQSVHDGEQRNNEAILQLSSIIEAMKPPNCWGQAKAKHHNGGSTPKRKSQNRVAESPFIDAGALLQRSAKEGGQPVNMGQFTRDLINLRQVVAGGTSLGLAAMFATLEKLVSSVAPVYARLSTEEKRSKAQSLTQLWTFAKANGEDAIGAFFHMQNPNVLEEWRRLCERIYRYITHAFSTTGYGNGVSAVLTDFRCNHHVTSCGCFERTVRLPAALKATKDLGAGIADNLQLITNVEQAYIEMAENKVLMKAHSAAYLRRMKSRCAQIQGNDIVYLTEDSDGNGGEDTKGSRGTWMAAVTSVAAAIKAVDLVIEGQCVNVFCITRPPGHHAGKNLHPMKAVSNGFCILNNAACAALHATTPLSEGGPGLRRVCVIDFDVHHGNGTQDILCSTYDPRFLYVSLHAGGAHVNGLPPSDDPEIHSPGQNSTKKGIYPGRCGDTSPHAGVLNIPLGPKVTSHAVGTALINQVSPAVGAFSPDLIILSAGFDAHKHDPLGLGDLSAEDFGHITDMTCQLASKHCSGRLISLLEGGYGVPCCRPQKDLLMPPTPQKKEEGKDSFGTGHSESKNDQGRKTELGTTEKSLKPPEEPACPTPQITTTTTQRPQPSKLLELGEDLPGDMDDQVPYALQRRLEKCHQEGFVECVRGHVGSMVKCNKRS